MAIDKQIRQWSVLITLILLVVLAYLVLKPILLSIIAGLILAFAFLPLYNWIYRFFRERNTAALAVCVLIVLALFIPLWFLIPIGVQQTFDLFKAFQLVDIKGIIETAFPIADSSFKKEITSAVITFVGNITTSIINSLIGILLNIPQLLLHLAVIVFVFFFTLRDQDKVRSFISGISPFKKDQEKILVKKFKEITSSIVYGVVVVGIIQGIATGVGLLIFGVPQPLVLTSIAIFASIIPLVGAWLVWIPAAIYLFISGSTGAAIGFTIYCVVFVSLIDNFLRPYIVSRKTGVSSVIVLIGMIGGILVFGILGIILGPLILAYLILFLEAYKNRALADMFH